MPFAGLFSTDVNTLGDTNVSASEMFNMYANYLAVKESERNLKLSGMIRLPKWGTWACLHGDEELHGSQLIHTTQHLGITRK